MGKIDKVETTFITKLSNKIIVETGVELWKCSRGKPNTFY